MNAIYDIARYQLLTAGLDWRTTPLVLSVWSGTPTFIHTHQKISDIVTAGFTELGFSQPITSQSVYPDGTAQTNIVVVPDVPVGPMVTWFTMSRRNAAHDQSSLILFIDEAQELPFDPNGLDMVIQPDWLESRGWFRP